MVGAGLAGLAAARELRAAGRDAIVLEARDRVGGRTLNEPIGDDKVVELGAQWVGPTQDRVLALIRELGLETFPTWAKGKNIFERGGKLGRYAGTIPRANPVGLAEVGVAMKRLNSDGGQGAAARPRGRRRRRPAGTRRPSRPGCGATSAPRSPATSCGSRSSASGPPSPRDVSLLHVLFYIRSAGSLEILTDTEGGAQQDRIVGGSQLISLRMAEQLGPTVVEL